jgi:glutaredoxin 3
MAFAQPFKNGCILHSMSKKVIIYSADWCAFCHAAKEYLDGKGIEYLEKNVEENPEYAQEAVEKSNQMGIPVIDIDDTIIVGFDRPKIDAALAQ